MADQNSTENTEQVEQVEATEERILFIDLETTGLDPRVEAPLEIAVVLTNKLGGVLDDFRCLVWEDTPEFTRPVANVRDNKLEPVFSMHFESGLWDDLDAGYREDPYISTREEASVKIIQFLREHDVKERKLPIAGFSIGSLDRPFLQHHFPALNKFLSHRNIDISSFREVCRRINPDLHYQIETAVENQGERVTHRAGDDCFYAVQMYREYIDSFFYHADD